MKFKVGDKVRVIRLTNTTKYIFSVGEEFEIIKVGNHAREDIVFKMGYQIGIGFADIELVDNNYITTKDFIKEVEKLGYRVEDSYSGEYFNIMSNKRDIIKIRKDKINVITTDYIVPISGDLFDLVVKYAKTPIEFREVKEYTLQCPLTSAYLCINSTTSGNTVWLHKNNFITNKKGIPKYTQQEIDNLPNQELIKCLIEKEVQND